MENNWERCVVTQPEGGLGQTYIKYYSVSFTLRNSPVTLHFISESHCRRPHLSRMTLRSCASQAWVVPAGSQPADS